MDTFLIIIIILVVVCVVVAVKAEMMLLDASRDQEPAGTTYRVIPKPNGKYGIESVHISPRIHHMMPSIPLILSNFETYNTKAEAQKDCDHLNGVM